MAGEIEKELDEKLKAIQEWIEDFERTKKNLQKPASRAISEDEIVLRATPIGAVFEEEVWIDFFNNFTKEFAKEVSIFVSDLYQEITGGGGDASKEFWPEAVIYKTVYDDNYEPGDPEYETREDVGKYPFPAYKAEGTPKSDMGKGIALLGQALATKYIKGDIKDAVDIGMGEGGAIFSLRLSDHMGTTGGPSADRTYNDLFYAVMFGTGMADKVGGHPRTDGRTKDRFDEGSWWFGLFEGQGVHFLGQLGLTVQDHFLWAPRMVPGKGGELLPSIKKELRDIFFSVLQRSIHARFKGVVQIVR